jgi:hypothetical protein
MRDTGGLRSGGTCMGKLPTFVEQVLPADAEMPSS